MPRRFRTKINKNKYKISAKRLEELEKYIDTKSLSQEQIKLVIRKSNVKGGDCLIVSPDGKISISSTRIANINENSPEEIVMLLKNNKNLKNIKANKKATYF